VLESNQCLPIPTPKRQASGSPGKVLVQGALGQAPGFRTDQVCGSVVDAYALGSQRSWPARQEGAGGGGRAGRPQRGGRAAGAGPGAGGERGARRGAARRGGGRRARGGAAGAGGGRCGRAGQPCRAVQPRPAAGACAAVMSPDQARGSVRVLLLHRRVQRHVGVQSHRCDHLSALTPAGDR